MLLVGFWGVCFVFFVVFFSFAFCIVLFWMLLFVRVVCCCFGGMYCVSVCFLFIFINYY